MTANRRYPAATRARASSRAPVALPSCTVANGRVRCETSTTRPPVDSYAASSSASRCSEATPSHRLPVRMIARGRCPRSTRTSSSSRSASRCVTAIVVAMRCSSAARIAPAAIDEKYGSAMSLTRSEIVVDSPFATAWAERFGV